MFYGVDFNALKSIFIKILNTFQLKDNSLLRYSKVKYLSTNGSSTISGISCKVGDVSYTKYKEVIFYKNSVTPGYMDLSRINIQNTKGWKSNFPISQNKINIPGGSYLIQVNFDSKIIIVKKYS